MIVVGQQTGLVTSNARIDSVDDAGGGPDSSGSVRLRRVCGAYLPSDISFDNPAKAKNSPSVTCASCG
jgi:hypothetical protein